MTGIVYKVTCFITQVHKNGPELLLFNHPNAGTQIPAGTVNPGEDIEAAASHRSPSRWLAKMADGY